MPIAGALKKVAKQTSADREKRLSKIQSEAVPLVDVAQTEASRLVAAKKAAAGKTAAGGSGAAAPKQKIALKHNKPRTKQMVPNPHKRKNTSVEGEGMEVDDDFDAVDDIPIAKRPLKKLKCKSALGSQRSPSERSKMPVDEGSRDELLEVAHVEGEAQKSIDGEASMSMGDITPQDDFWDFGLMQADPVTPMPKRFQHLCHLKPEFMGNPSVPEWCEDIKASISSVPPLMNMVGEWSPEARRAICAGLARRVTPEVFYPTWPDGEKALEAAMSELGFFAHATSTCIKTALETIRQGKRREEFLVEKVRSSGEIEKSRTEFQKVVDEIQTKMNDFGKQVADKDETMKKLKSEVEQLQSSLKIKLKAAKTELETVRQQAADDAAAAKAAEAEAKTACEKAIKDRDSYKSRYHKLKASVDEKVTSGVKRHVESVEFEASINKCFHKGVNHMARCFLDSTVREKEVDLERLAKFAKTDAFSRRLSKYHGLVPYLEGEVDEYNEWAVGQGLAQVTGVPPIEVTNLSTLKEIVAASDDEEVTEEQVDVEDVAEDGATGQDDQGIAVEKGANIPSESGEKIAEGSNVEKDPAVEKDGAVLEKEQIAGDVDA